MLHTLYAHTHTRVSRINAYATVVSLIYFSQHSPNYCTPTPTMHAYMLLASFFLPSHLSFKNMYNIHMHTMHIYNYIYTQCTCTKASGTSCTHNACIHVHTQCTYIHRSIRDLSGVSLLPGSVWPPEEVGCSHLWPQ